jgi:hypothetical protein
MRNAAFRAVLWLFAVMCLLYAIFSTGSPHPCPEWADGLYVGMALLLISAAKGSPNV